MKKVLMVSVVLSLFFVMNIVLAIDPPGVYCPKIGSQNECENNKAKGCSWSAGSCVGQCQDVPGPSNEICKDAGCDYFCTEPSPHCSSKACG